MLFREYAKLEGTEKAVPFLMKLIGDEDVWRSTEEGKHFKIEKETGTIRAGFGGKLNGAKLGSSFKEHRAAAKPVVSKSEPPKRTEKQEKTLQATMKRIRGLKKEQSFIIAPDGEIKAQAKGDKHSVGMTAGQKREHLKGAISLHNHPDGGTFSTADLRDFGYGATEICVSGPDGDYSLKNMKIGTPEQYNGWFEMQQRMEATLPMETSSLDLMRRADANLKGNETRQKMDEIAQTWVKMKDAGASADVLQAYYDNSGYEELSKKAAQERKDEIRRLETEPFHEFYKQHAAEYGFEYTFTPKNGEPEVYGAKSATPVAREESISYNPSPASKADAYGSNDFSAGFTPESMARHKKHCEEVGAKDEEEYNEKAIAFGSQPVGGKISGGIDKKGRVVRYDKETCELFIGDPNTGNIITYFVVKEGRPAVAEKYMKTHFSDIDLNGKAQYIGSAGGDRMPVVDVKSGFANDSLSGDRRPTFACPVCGQITLYSRGNWDGCSNCGWIDDIGQNEDFPDETFCSNKMSLNEAREAYRTGKKVV